MRQQSLQLPENILLSGNTQVPVFRLSAALPEGTFLNTTDPKWIREPILSRKNLPDSHVPGDGWSYCP